MAKRPADRIRTCTAAVALCRRGDRPVAAQRALPTTPARRRKPHRISTVRSSNYTTAVRKKPDDRTAQLALERARLRASQEHYLPRPPASGRRALRRGTRRVPARLGAQSCRPPTSTPPFAKRGRSSEPGSPSRGKARPNCRLSSTRSRDLAPPGLELPEEPSCPTRWCSAMRAACMVFRAIGALGRTSASSSIPAFRDAPITVDLRNISLADALDVGHGEHPHLLPRHRAAHDHDRARHAGQAARVRRGGRPHVLPEQRRHQGSRSTCCASWSTSGRSLRSPRPTRSRSRTRRNASPPPRA